MAGENVTESVVAKVFGSAIDFVVHLDRSPRTGRRITAEIGSVMTTSRSMATKALFGRNPNGDLEWLGDLPAAELKRRIEAAS